MMDRFVTMPSMPELPKKKPFFWNASKPLPEPTRPSRRRQAASSKRRPSPPPPKARASGRADAPSADVEVARAAAAARVRRKRQEDRVRWQQELSEMLEEPQQDVDEGENDERRPRGVDVADRAAAAAGMQAAAAAAHRAKRFADIARRRAAAFARQAAGEENVLGESPRRQSRLPSTKEPPLLPRTICGEEDENSYYSVLGVSRRATSIELKKAFFRLALRYHPDRSKSPEATAKMTRLNEAYSCLADPHSRYRYDQTLKYSH